MEKNTTRTEPLTLDELRNTLFELLRDNDGEAGNLKVHIVKESKFGEVVSTAGITNAKVTTHGGFKHITLTTTN